MNLEADLAVAQRAAAVAGELLLERFGETARGVERKSSRTDMVSDADRDAEAAIGEILSAERPGDGLLAEEGASRQADSGRRWVVDPLDGTTNFLYGIPAWCVSIALEDADGGALGVVLDPVRGETFTAIRGQGATRNGKPIAVSGEERLDTALVATGFSYEAAERSAQATVLAEVLPRVRDVRRVGAAALDLCWVAAGRLDAYYERGLKHWDWAAASLIVAEADGELRWLEDEPRGLVAGPPALVEDLLGLVRP